MSLAWRGAIVAGTAIVADILINLALIRPALRLQVVALQAGCLELRGRPRCATAAASAPAC